MIYFSARERLNFNNKLIIIGTNFTKGREEVFSVDTSPEMDVVQAIRISID